MSVLKGRQPFFYMLQCPGTRDKNSYPSYCPDLRIPTGYAAKESEQFIVFQVN